ncbi:hypothetical protein VP01_1232g1 [Puccinia sorghi]|uniref:Uncharacterized protein n=1 Tax=Puccinia sorghi TaxID=27349 RepID=A0A0L6VPR3_9BASI|nr:hypothetical protein VP01_1232g1 [Puccinia sorghi]
MRTYCVSNITNPQLETRQLLHKSISSLMGPKRLLVKKKLILKMWKCSTIGYNCELYSIVMNNNWSHTPFKMQMKIKQTKANQGENFGLNNTAPLVSLAQQHCLRCNFVFHKQLTISWGIDPGKMCDRASSPNTIPGKQLVRFIPELTGLPVATPTDHSDMLQEPQLTEINHSLHRPARYSPATYYVLMDGFFDSSTINKQQTSAIGLQDRLSQAIHNLFSPLFLQSFSINLSPQHSPQAQNLSLTIKRQTYILVLHNMCDQEISTLSSCNSYIVFNVKPLITFLILADVCNAILLCKLGLPLAQDPRDQCIQHPATIHNMPENPLLDSMIPPTPTPDAAGSSPRKNVKPECDPKDQSKRNIGVALTPSQPNQVVQRDPTDLYLHTCDTLETDVDMCFWVWKYTCFMRLAPLRKSMWGFFTFLITTQPELDFHNTFYMSTFGCQKCDIYLFHEYILMIIPHAYMHVVLFSIWNTFSITHLYRKSLGFLMCAIYVRLRVLCDLASLSHVLSVRIVGSAGLSDRAQRCIDSAVLQCLQKYDMIRSPCCVILCILPNQNSVWFTSLGVLFLISKRHSCVHRPPSAAFLHSTTCTCHSVGCSRCMQIWCWFCCIRFDRTSPYYYTLICIYTAPPAPRLSPFDLCADSTYTSHKRCSKLNIKIRINPKNQTRRTHVSNRSLLDYFLLLPSFDSSLSSSRLSQEKKEKNPRKKKQNPIYKIQTVPQVSFISSQLFLSPANDLEEVFPTNHFSHLCAPYPTYLLYIFYRPIGFLSTIHRSPYRSLEATFTRPLQYTHLSRFLNLFASHNLIRTLKTKTKNQYPSPSLPLPQLTAASHSNSSPQALLNTLPRKRSFLSRYALAPFHLTVSIVGLVLVVWLPQCKSMMMTTFPLGYTRWVPSFCSALNTPPFQLTLAREIVRTWLASPGPHDSLTTNLDTWALLHLIKSTLKAPWLALHPIQLAALPKATNPPRPIRISQTFLFRNNIKSIFTCNLRCSNLVLSISFLLFSLLLIFSTFPRTFDLIAI